MVSMYVQFLDSSFVEKVTGFLIYIYNVQTCQGSDRDQRCYFVFGWKKLHVRMVCHHMVTAWGGWNNCYGIIDLADGWGVPYIQTHRSTPVLFNNKQTKQLLVCRGVWADSCITNKPVCNKWGHQKKKWIRPHSEVNRPGFFRSSSVNGYLAC